MQLFEPLQKALGTKAVYLKKEAILKHLQEHVQDGDMVIFLGAGDIYHLSDELVKILGQNSSPVPYGTGALRRR